MNARNTILQAIASRKKRQAVPDIWQQANDLLTNIDETRPQHDCIDTAALVQRFICKATSPELTATAEIVATRHHITTCAQQYLESIDASELLIGTDPYLLNLDWKNIRTTHAISRNPLVAMTLAEQAIAETGSLVVASSPEQPFVLHYLALHHLAVIKQSTICAWLEDMHIGHGRSTGIITGTSGTADIEGQNTRGAHGPRYLHLLIVSND